MHQYHDKNYYLREIKDNPKIFIMAPRNIREDQSFFYQAVAINHEVLNYMNLTKPSNLTSEFLEAYVAQYGFDVLEEIPPVAACWNDSHFCEVSLQIGYVPDSEIWLQNVAYHEPKTLHEVLHLFHKKDEPKQIAMIRHVFKENNPQRDNDDVIRDVADYFERKLDGYAMYDFRQQHYQECCELIAAIPDDIMQDEVIYQKCLQLVDYYECSNLYRAATMTNERLTTMLSDPSEGASLDNIQKIAQHAGRNRNDTFDVMARMLSIHPEHIPTLLQQYDHISVVQNEQRQKMVDGYVGVFVLYAHYSGDHSVLNEDMLSRPIYKEMNEYVSTHLPSQEEIDIYI